MNSGDSENSGSSHGPAAAGKAFFAVLALAYLSAASAEPHVVSTDFLGPFTGLDAPLHRANEEPHRAHYYGTDLGFSYEHNGAIQFLFGDTVVNRQGERIDPATGGLTDDMYGWIELSDWPDPTVIDSDHIPRIRLGQYPDSPELFAIDPGHVFDGLKTPEAGWSNGSNEFAVLLLTKPEGCAGDEDCSNGMTCDTGLGYFGAPYWEPRGTTLACEDSEARCTADTMNRLDGVPIEGTGFCTDRTSSVWADTPAGRVSSISLKQRIGIRDPNVRYRYRKVRDWMTNKFLNTTVSTVECFDPAAGPDASRQDYSIATGAGGCRSVLLWGRPGFTGVGAKGRPMNLYLAYADMPAAPDFGFELNYFSGTDADGKPLFSKQESEAVALDLDARSEGVQPDEQHDIVQHMSVSWIGELGKWVMFYGGGIDITPMPQIGFASCGLLEIFAGTECRDAVVGNGAIRMRTADHPWGPWSTPEDVIIAGNPTVPGSGQYGVGGSLAHPACTQEGCAPRSKIGFMNDAGYGWFYGANIIEQWTRPAENGVDVIWNASTWDPYRVILLRTRISR